MLLERLKCLAQAGDKVTFSLTWSQTGVEYALSLNSLANLPVTEGQLWSRGWAQRTALPASPDWRVCWGLAVTPLPALSLGFHSCCQEPRPGFASI